MKKIFLLVVLCVVAFISKGQDVIVTNQGKEINSKIIETNSKFVKFKIFSQNDNQICRIKQKIKHFKKQNLPVEEQVFTLPKKEVFRIEYENGKNEFYSEVKDKTVKNVLNFIDVNNNPEAYKLYRDGYKQYNLSKGLIGAGAGLGAFGVITLLYNSFNDKYSNSDIGGGFVFTGFGTALLFAGLLLNESSSVKMNKAFDIYKKTLNTAQSNFKLDFGITQNGMGFNMKF